MNQLTKGESQRVMYLENKELGVAYIGWVSFSKTGSTIYYRGMELAKQKGGGVRGNFVNVETGEEYWVSGIKKRGSNAHWAERVTIEVDPDAKAEYERLRHSGAGA